MFVCTTELICDFCGKYYSSTGNKMADCISKQRFRDCQHKKAGKLFTASTMFVRIVFGIMA